MQESGFTVTICKPTKRSIASCSRAGMDSIFRSATYINREFKEKDDSHNIPTKRTPKIYYQKKNYVNWNMPLEDPTPLSSSGGRPN
jgi:hypothetical protein